MRILHIDKFLGSKNLPSGGINRYIEQVSQLAQERGHSVLTFGCDESGEGEFPIARDFTSSANRRKWWRLMVNRQAAKKLDTFLKANPVDIAHLHNLYHHLTTSILPVLAKHHVPCVMTVHDLRQLCGESIFWRWELDQLKRKPEDAYIAEARKYCTGLSGMMLRTRLTFERITGRYRRHVKLFLCPSEFVKQRILLAGIDPAKAWTMRNPADIPEPTGQAEGPPTLLWFGRLAPEKSPELALAAAMANPNAKLIFAGDGPRTELLQRYIRMQKLENVELLGRVDRAALAGLLKQASAVLLTSRCNENSPAAMLEAMAAGKCVIAPDQPAIREWIRDGQTGRLFENGNADALTAAVGDVLADPVSTAAMGNAARDFIIQNHNPQHLADELIAVYESLTLNIRG